MVAGAVATLAEVDKQLASATKDLELARKRNAFLSNRLLQIEVSVINGTRRGGLLSIFDAGWYSRQNPEVRKSSLDPLEHYLQFGAVEGRDPNPLFDVAWYVRQNPDVRKSGMNPLVHYLLRGGAEGLDPHPLFDSDWYLSKNADVRNSEINPLVHYLQFGAFEGRDPHPLFDAAWYMRQNPDAREAAVNPLLHYLHVGAAQGCSPHPLFDAAWYQARNPDLRESALVHYLLRGGAEGLDPHPDSARRPLFSRERSHPTGTILIVDTQPEYDKHAGGLATFQHIQLIAECGMKVFFIPYDGAASQPYTKALQQLGIEVLYGDLDVERWLDEVGRYIDCVWLARPEVSTRYLHLMWSKTLARIIYFTHDLHYLRELRRSEIEPGSSATKNAEGLKRVELDTFNLVDCVVTPSVHEARIISALAPHQTVQVLPLHYFDLSAENVDCSALPLGDRRDIIFIGSEHAPNVDAVIVLVKSVMPIVWRSVPDARVLILGSVVQDQSVLALESPLVKIVGYVPDLKPYYDGARMSVSPLRFGAGVKGKILSSLAAGVPVVTTAIGNEGIGLREEVEVLVGETAQEIAAHIIRLYADGATLNRLATSGRRVIAKHYSKEKMRDALMAALGLWECSACGCSRPAQAGPRNANDESVCRQCAELRATDRADKAGAN